MEPLIIALTTILSYVALFLVAKLIGRKQISQLDFLDYITGLEYAKTAVLASGDGISVSIIERNR